MVGYGRVSTDEEKQLYSLENQLLFFHEFAQKYNYKLIRVYADEGISGKQLKKRDEFRKMLRDAEDGTFDVVVVKDVSRFARNTVDLLTSVRAFRSKGINVLFVNNNQQTLGESEFVITLLGAMAQEESANLSKRVQFGKDVTARRGRVPKTILGYDYIDNYTLKINEEEAELVRRIYTMYLSGSYGMAAIAAALRRENTRTKRGCEYTEGYIRRVLMNPIYCGDLVNHKTQITDFINGVRKNVPAEEQYHHNRPELTIISRENFEEAQRIREERCQMQIAKGGDPRRRYSNRYLFSGLVRCGECGCMMYRQNVNRKGYDRMDSYWRCKNSIGLKSRTPCKNKVYVPDSILREGLLEGLERCIPDKESFVQEVWEQRKEEGMCSTEEVLSEKQKTMEKLWRQKQKYMEMYAHDLLDLDELKIRTNKLTGLLETLRQEIAVLSQNAETFENIQGKKQECFADVEKILSLEGMDNATVRKILSHIEVKADKTIVFAFRIRQETT